MHNNRPLAVAVCAALLMMYGSGNNDPDAAQQAAQPPVLRKAMHWSYRPKLSQGSQFLSQHFIEFTPAGFEEPIRAKVFLIEVHPPDALRDQLPANIPSTIFGSGFEIAVEDLERFEPTFKIPPKHVKPDPMGQGYRVQVGDVSYKVRTAMPEDAEE